MYLLGIFVTVMKMGAGVLIIGPNGALVTSPELFEQVTTTVIIFPASAAVSV